MQYAMNQVLADRLNPYRHWLAYISRHNGWVWFQRFIIWVFQRVSRLLSAAPTPTIVAPVPVAPIPIITWAHPAPKDPVVYDNGINAVMDAAVQIGLLKLNEKGITRMVINYQWEVDAAFTTTKQNWDELGKHYTVMMQNSHGWKRFTCFHAYEDRSIVLPDVFAPISEERREFLQSLASKPGRRKSFSGAKAEKSDKAKKAEKMGKMGKMWWRRDSV